MDDIDQSTIPESPDFDEELEHLVPNRYFIIYLIICIVLSLLGNTFVLCRIVRNPRLREKSILFLNLSLADILTVLATHIYHVIMLQYGFSWTAGNALCKIFTCAQRLVAAGSIYGTIVITLNQFVVLVQPTCCHLSTKLLIAGAWLLALLTALPHLYTAAVIKIIDTHHVCHPIGSLSYELVSSHLIYTCLMLTLHAYLPFFVGMIIYAVIFFKSKRQRWIVFTSEKCKMLMLSSTIFGIALITGMPNAVHSIVIYYSDFDFNKIVLDVWLYLIALSRHAITPYAYILFYFKEIFCKPVLEQPDSMPLVEPVLENDGSSLTVFTQSGIDSSSCR